MNIPTREELIRQKKWRVAVVQTEVGPITVAEPAFDAPQRMRPLLKRRAAGEDVEEEMTAEMLRSGCVADDGAPLFDSPEAARQLFPSITPGSMRRLIAAYSGLVKGEPEEGDEQGKAVGSLTTSPTASAPSSAALTQTTSTGS